MSKIILGNGFSLQMLGKDLLDGGIMPTIQKVSISEVANADFFSCVGHADIANVITQILGKEVAFNRCNVTLEKGDILYVAQLMGGRLPEGATTLPEGFKLEFIKVAL